MRALARRLDRLEQQLQAKAAPGHPTHYVGLALDDATDEELEAMAVLAAEQKAMKTKSLLHINGSSRPELVAAAELLVVGGANLSASGIVMAG